MTDRAEGDQIAHPDSPAARELAAAENLVDAFASLTQHLRYAEADPTLAAQGLEDDALAHSIALVQDIRRRLGDVERDLTVALGERLGKTTGNLSDGRQFTLSRTQDRKEWDHDDWKRDARRVIVERTMGDLPARATVVAETGEAQEDVNLAAMVYEAITMAQEVHGSTAPRSRALKDLGLYASDYCTSQPGGWRFAAHPPTTTEETTTDV